MMNKIICKVFGVAVILLSMNCKSTENEVKINKEDVGLIGKGNLYGSGAEGIEKQNIVISTYEAWKILLAKINSVNNVSKDFSETNINFSNYNVIAVFDEVKTSGGYDLLLEINSQSDKIEVAIITNHLLVWRAP